MCLLVLVSRWGSSRFILVIPETLRSDGRQFVSLPFGGQCVGILLIYLLRASTCLAVTGKYVAVAFSRRWSYPRL